MFSAFAPTADTRKAPQALRACRALTIRRPLRQQQNMPVREQPPDAQPSQIRCAQPGLIRKRRKLPPVRRRQPHLKSGIAFHEANVRRTTGAATHPESDSNRAVTSLSSRCHLLLLRRSPSVRHSFRSLPNNG